jgi:glycosyltransferase involved in cell wall biosynthesis
VHKPLISVVMSVYNNRDFVGEAIRSILNQTFHDFEFLITDDGSTDESAGIIDELAATDTRIRVFHQENTGLTIALNRMIAESHGNYIARMDADDISHPLRFEDQLKYLSTHAMCAVVGTGYLVIDAQGRPIGGVQAYDNPQALRSKITEASGNPLCHGSVMMRRDALVVLDPIYRWKYSQDFDLWLRLLESWEVGVIESVLYQFRWHDAGLHAKSNLYALRYAQRKVIIHLMNRGLLFDNEACRNAVAQLYREKLHVPGSGQEPQHCAGCERQLNALFLSGDFGALRQAAREVCSGGDFSYRIALLWLMSFLPVTWGHGAYDLMVRLSCLMPRGQRRLFMREINNVTLWDGGEA